MPISYHSDISVSYSPLITHWQSQSSKIFTTVNACRPIQLMTNTESANWDLHVFTCEKSRCSILLYLLQDCIFMSSLLMDLFAYTERYVQPSTPTALSMTPYYGLRRMNGLTDALISSHAVAAIILFFSITWDYSRPRYYSAHIIDQALKIMWLNVLHFVMTWTFPPI